MRTAGSIYVPLGLQSKMLGVFLAVLFVPGGIGIPLDSTFLPYGRRTPSSSSLANHPKTGRRLLATSPSCSSNPYSGSSYYQNCNTYILADVVNHQVFIIGVASDAGGSKVLLAGSGVAGTVAGTNTSAQFNKPLGNSVSPDGTFVIVGEVSGCVLRKVYTSNGNALIVAGSAGLCSSLDGVGSAARLSNVYAVAYIPGSSTKYLVADYSPALKIYNDATGSVQTVASLSFNPSGVTITNDGSTAYITGSGSYSIWSMNMNTFAVTTWISNTGSQIYGQVGLSPDNSMMAVPAYNANQLLFYSVASKTNVRQLGTGQGANVDGPSSAVQFFSLGWYNGPVYSLDGGNIYLEQQSGCLRIINSTAYSTSTFCWPGGVGYISLIPPTSCPSMTSTPACSTCPSSQYLSLIHI